jgi:AcrR family transcriptional regulator
MGSRPATRFEQLREERRGELLRAARAVFARKGFMAAKITDIAARAGSSHGLVHHYIPTKEALFAAVIEESLQGWEHLLADARALPLSAWERLVTVCTRMTEGSAAAPEHLLVVVHASTDEDVPPGVREVLGRVESRLYAPLAALIAEAQRTGHAVAAPAEELARAWVAMAQGLAISQALHPRGPRPPIELALRLLKA